MLKLHNIIPCIAAALLASCTADVPFTWTEPDTPTAVTPELTTDIDTTIRDYDGTTASDADNDVVGNDKSFYWEANKFTNKVNVTFSGNTATVASALTGLVTSIDGAYVTIDMATNAVKNVEITVQGQTSDGALKIYGKNKFKLTLNGADITSQRGPAINDQCKKRVFVHLADGTVNKLTDQSEYVAEPYYQTGASIDTEDAKGCFFSEGNIIMSGSGSLIVDAYHRHGVATDGYLWVRPGVTLAVTHAAKNAIHAKGDVEDNLGIVVNGGYIYANVAADGGKCLKTDNNIVINGGSLDLNTSGTAYFDTEDNDTSTSTCLKSDLSTAIHGGAIVMKSVGDDAKGINADKSIYLTGGEIYAYSVGRNFAADELVEISGGKTYTFSLDEYAVYAPTVSVTGGYVVSVSANAELSAPKQSAQISAGYVAAYGNSCLTNPSAASKQAYALCDGVTMQSGKTVAIAADSNCMIGFTADFTEGVGLPLLFSAPEMTAGKQYTLAHGATVVNPTATWQCLLLGGTLSSSDSTETIQAK